MRIHMTDRKEVVSPTRVNGYYIQSTEPFIPWEPLFRYDVSPRRANGYHIQSTEFCLWIQEHLFRYDVALGFSQDFWNCDNHKQESATHHQNTIMKPKDPSGGGAPCISSGSRPEGPCSFSCEAKLYRKECDLWGIFEHTVANSYIRSVPCKVNFILKRKLVFL